MMKELMFVFAVIKLMTLAYAGTAPKISSGGSVLKSIPDKKVILPCEATGDPQPTITWERDGEPINKFGNRFSVNIDSNTLRIFSLQVGDHGNYTCIAQNKFGVDTITNTLFVMVLPDAKIVSPTNLTFMELTNQELVCRSRGIPQPRFEWLINNHKPVRASNHTHPRNSSTRLFSKDRQVGERMYESVLVFQPIISKDFGSVACVAYNDIGHSRVTVTLNVLFSPKVLSQHALPRTVAWWEGHNTNLTCVVAGNDLPKITWSLDGHLFNCSNPKEVKDGVEITSSCMITHKSDGGPGVYRCSAENSLGKILAHEFHVREKFPPSPVEFSPVSSNLDEVILSFKVPIKEDTPPATYVLASYKLVSDDPRTQLIPHYERMGDVNKQGEGTVKLVGVKENSEYIVKVRARNSVGFGPETAKIINTAIHPLSTVSSTFSTVAVKDKKNDESALFDIGSRTIDEEIKEENEDISYKIENNYPTALTVKGSDSGAVAVYGNMWFWLTGHLLSVCCCFVCSWMFPYS